MNTAPTDLAPPTRRAILLPAAFGVLMFGAGVLMYFDNGFAVEPRDAAFALQFLALLVLPHMIAALVLRPSQQRLGRRLASACSAVLLVVFPLSIEARLWSEASHADGRPMYTSFGGADREERAKAWDAYFGYEPLWKSPFRPDEDWTRYEGTDSGQRHAYKNYVLWGKGAVYALNRNLVSEPPQASRPDGSPAKVYECITEEFIHVLGFYWRDMRDRRDADVTSPPDSGPPKSRCTLIDTPEVGADRR